MPSSELFTQDYSKETAAMNAVPNLDAFKGAKFEPGSFPV